MPTFCYRSVSAINISYIFVTFQCLQGHNVHLTGKISSRALKVCSAFTCCQVRTTDHFLPHREKIIFRNTFCILDFICHHNFVWSTGILIHWNDIHSCSKNATTISALPITTIVHLTSINLKKCRTTLSYTCPQIDMQKFVRSSLLIFYIARANEKRFVAFKKQTLFNRLMFKRTKLAFCPYLEE